MRKITIKGEFTDLNAYIKALNSHYLSGNKVKQQETDRVYWECMAKAIQPIEAYPVKILFVWHSKDQRKDIDNVAFAKKFVLDGLAKAGVIENDSRQFVGAFEDRFFIDKKNPRLEITISAL